MSARAIRQSHPILRSDPNCFIFGVGFDHNPLARPITSNLYGPCDFQRLAIGTRTYDNGGAKWCCSDGLANRPVVTIAICIYNQRLLERCGLWRGRWRAFTEQM